MTRGETSLLHRCGCQRWKTNHISNSVNVRAIRLEMLIDFQEAPFICDQACGFDIKRTCRARAPNAVERHLCDDLFAACKMYLYAVAMFVGDRFDHINFFTKAHYGTLLIKMIGERVYDFRVHEWEQAAAFVNDSDAHTKRSKDASIFK